ncbi:MAG: ATP-binding protein [Oscillospiraceae bacterium]|nr:ATP-binding protein [Oscillospiraceae bacterium]
MASKKTNNKRHPGANNKIRLTMLEAVVKATRIGLWDITIAEGSPIHPDNVFIWSDEFRHMLGFSSTKDFPNTFDAWASRLHPDDYDDAFKAVSEHLDDKTDKTPYDVEYRLQKRDGSYGYFRACGHAIRDKHGTAIRVAGAIMDITETKNILQTTEEQRQSAVAASEAKSAFLSNMSHEIRTPINMIIGMTSIGKTAPDSEKKDYAFDKIENASRHLLGVINDILDMSKIEANKLVLSPVSFEFEKMLNNVVGIFESEIDNRRQKLHISVSKNIPRLLIGDDQRLSQVIANLLSNAVKFTPEGGQITLKAMLLSSKEDVCRLKISVSDTGIGITEDQKDNLFESFTQAKAGISRTFGGTGLGLSISKRIVDLMDGSIRADSKYGKGSTFTFTVALLRGSPSSDACAGKLSGKMVADDLLRTDFSGHTILVVEDIDINREIMHSMLSSFNLTVEYAENGAAAIDLFTESPDKYDVIFMDIHMPVMDGLSATRRIRELDIPNASSVPIIAMTANVFREDIDECLKAGMNSHIGKPINADDVVMKLNYYLT